MKKQIIKTISISFLTSSFLFGANVPTISDIEKQVKPPKEVEQKQAPLIEISGAKKYAPTMTDDKSGKTIFVKNFKIDGAIHIEESKLQALISSYNGRELTFMQLQEVSSIITKEYRNQGYFVARAYIPVQEIKKNDGEFILAIIEGNYGEFKLKNNSLVKDSVVQGMLDYAKRDNIVSTNTLEQSMLIINDTPGAIVTQADVRPGSEVGTSDFIITTEKTNRVDGYVLTDNAGSRYTGKNRLMAGLNINSPFDIGDKIALSGLVSNSSNLLNGRVAYSAPLSSNGLIGEMSYSQTNYDLTKEYKNLDAEGTAKTVDATLKYPVIRTRSENLDINLNIANKNLEDKINSTNDVTKKDTQSITIGTDYDKSYVVSNFNSLSKASFNLKYGNLNFDDETKKATDIAGANTDGNYSKVNLDLSNTIAFTNELSLDAGLKMQYALGNKNLDGSEDISIGGSSGVKLYPDSEISAENGYVFNTEVKYKLPSFENLNNSVGIFYDRGRVWMANNNVNFETKALQDAGVGYYASYNRFFGQTQVAWNVNSNDVTSEPNRNSRILFQAGMTF